ncbi:MAG: choice-of-anchor D domain-containing protein [Myxococcaceae bacterium]|nr:choice-of-anchor D domain-containing protein [Myxococcaceae bacterium]
MKLLTLVITCLTAFVIGCERPEPNVQGTNRGELKLSLPDAGMPSFEAAHGFGDVKVGESKKLSFEVVNTGPDALDIRVVKVMTDDPGAFFVQGGTGSVAPAARRAFSVTFAPARMGAHSGNLVFETNANSETARIALTGNAVP